MIVQYVKVFGESIKPCHYGINIPSMGWFNSWVTIKFSKNYFLRIGG